MRGRPARQPDAITLSTFLFLIGIGWAMLYSVGYGTDGYQMSIADFLRHTQVGKQTLWLIISLSALFITQLIDKKFWQTFAYPIYGLTLLMLIGVLIFGKEIKGATSWYNVMGFTLQPSEFAKFGTGLAMAAFLGNASTDLRIPQHVVRAFVLIVLPMGLILLQPDAGSALVFLSFLVAMYRKGLTEVVYLLGFFVSTLLILGIMFEDAPLKVILGLILLAAIILSLSLNKKLYGLLIAVIMVVISWLAKGEAWQNLTYLLAANGLILAVLGVVNWLQGRQRLVSMLTVAIFIASSLVVISGIGYDFLAPHQQARIDVWLNPEKVDPQGAGYNLDKSKLAISSGGLRGKGFLEGNLTKGDFVPEQSTDFIFCTVGEEQGFIGTVGLLAFYLLFLFRITVLAERQRSPFARYFAYGIAGIFFLHFFVNIGMTMGITPIIGIPLPLVSKGGSSLLAFSIMVGVLLKMDRHRTEI